MRRHRVPLIIVLVALGCVEALQRPDNALPTAEILSPSVDTIVRIGESVQFAGRGTDTHGTVSERVWRFGNGDSTRAADNVTYAFMEPGTWTATYQVFDANGLGSVPDSVGITVVVPNTPPTAVIVTPSRDTTVRAGDPVVFMGMGNDADGSILMHRWVFGDAGEGTGADPGPQTFAIGAHWVRYTVEDDGGAVSNADSVRITALEPTVNQPPVATIDAPSADTTVTLGDAVTFAGTGLDPDGTVAAHAWSFGDGGGAVVEDPGGHVYTDPGSYWATYRVTDDDGEVSAPDSVEVTVVPPANQRPDARIDAPGQDTTVTLGGAVTFRGTAGDADGSVSEHAWDFGDGTGAAVEDPADHAYAAVGSYWATYRATDDAGEESVPDSVQVTVVTVPNEIPTATILTPSQDTTVTAGDPVTFGGTASDPDGSVTEHAWDFGDGSTAAGQDPPAHSYASSGSYWAVYQVTDDAGAQSTPDSVRITVVLPNQPPQAVIVRPSQDTTVTVGDGVSFVGAASDPDGSVSAHAWDFGDGTTATVQVPPAHVFTTTGGYWVTYRVTDDDGEESAPDTVRVTVQPVPNQRPVATIVAPGSDTVVTLGDAVTFAGSASDADGSVTAHQWNFGDGNGAAVEDPGAHTYASAGVYRATYRVTDDAGDFSIRDTVTVTVEQAGGGPNYALRFFGNGVNDIDRVKIPIDDADGSAGTPGPPVDVGATDFTIEFWMRGFANENNAPPNFCGSWTTGNMILDRDRFGLDRKFGLSMAGGIITFGLTGNGTGESIVCGTTRVDDGDWHHIAVTRVRSSGAIAVFIDGVREGFIANGPGGDVSYPDLAGCSGQCPNANHFLVLGAEKHDATPDAPSFSGWMDELRVSMTIRYTANFTPPNRRFVTDAQTVGLYHFDEGTGTAVSDESGAPGGPSDGFLRVGGNPTGPIWVVSDAPTGS